MRLAETEEIAEGMDLAGAREHIHNHGIHDHGNVLGKMFYQISWTTLPGLRGLACSEFRATPTSAPDSVRGVAVECASAAESAALVMELEAHFGPMRFLNASAAFDGVKDYIAQRAPRQP